MEGWLEREVVVWRMRVALEANDAARPGSASSNTKRMDSIEPHPCIAQRISDDLPHLRSAPSWEFREPGYHAPEGGPHSRTIL